MEKITKNIFPILIIAAIVAIGGYYYVTKGKTNQPMDKTKAEEAAGIAIEYINKMFLGGETTASLINVSQVGEILEIKFNIQDKEYTSYVSKDGKFLFPEGYQLDKMPKEELITLGNFTVTEEEVCKENDKPIVYFFGSKTCPHCQWEHPIVAKVIKRFGSSLAFHDNIDSTSDQEIFSKYSTGGIPTLVLGCRYYRVGSGESDGEEQDEKNLTALTCKLTDNQPAAVCDAVKDLIDQAK